MSSHTVRISDEGKRRLEQLSALYQLSQTKTLQKCLEDAYRDKILEEANRAYARLKADEAAWREEQEERKLWDNTLRDGLEDDEYPLG
jgi:uncharacterized membrane protein YcjF (UPF0283 family)